MPTTYHQQAPVPPPSYHRREVQAQAQRAQALYINALSLIETLHPAFVVPLGCSGGASALSATLTQRRRRPPTYLPRRVLAAHRLAQNALATLPTWDVHDWLESWPALALACGLPLDATGKPSVPSPSQLCNRWQAAGAPPFETLFVLTVWRAVRSHLIGARDLIIDSAPILAWRRKDPDAATGHAPAHHPRPLLRGYRVHTLLCRGSGLPVQFLVSPANLHDAPFARPLLVLAVQLYRIRPRIIRLDAGYWGLELIHWIHATWEPWRWFPGIPSDKRTARVCRPSGPKTNWACRSSIERFFGRVFLFFRLQRPPYSGWSTIVRQVALTYTASIIVALAAWQAHRSDLIRSPKQVLAHLWEDSQL
jgi:hypothetical protein